MKSPTPLKNPRKKYVTIPCGKKIQLFSESYMYKECALQIRYINMYNQGDITHYNQRLETCTVRQCWEECYRNSDFDKRKAEIEEFNR